MECCYLARSCLSSLEQDVKAKIELGWEPIGSVILERGPPGELNRWVQTMNRGQPSIDRVVLKIFRPELACKNEPL